MKFSGWSVVRYSEILRLVFSLPTTNWSVYSIFNYYISRLMGNDNMEVNNDAYTICKAYSLREVQLASFTCQQQLWLCLTKYPIGLSDLGAWMKCIHAITALLVTLLLC